MERKLTAIFSADVKGYSRLMGDNEEATIRTLTSYREVMTSIIQQHRGRVVDSPGDNLLAEFASAVDAVQGAAEIQRELQSRNVELPDERKMQYRIGINVGDVIIEGERLYGDGVNIAARLEGLAEPGGICISGTVYDQVENKLALNYAYVGEQEVKNIAKPVRVYRLALEVPSPLAGEGQGEGAIGEAERQKVKVETQKVQGEEPQPRRVRPVHRWVVAGLVLVTVTIVAVRYLPFFLLSPQSSALITQEAQLPLPDKPSIAVLPFTNMSGDPGQEYFSDGMTEAIITDLSQLSGLFVIARNSVFTYKGKAVKVNEVSRELGVRYVLEGSVQKADSRVRITAQLVDATTSGHLWAKNYDRELKDIFALQDEITQAGSGDVQASTGSGSIRASGVSGAMRASTGSGSISVEGKLSGPWDLETSSGSITVQLPAAAVFELDAHTGSGEVYTNHPVTVVGSFDQGTLKGTIRGGGPRLIARTGSGSIRIE